MTSPAPTPTGNSISVPAAVLLGVTVVSVTILGALIAAQAIFPLRVYEGATALLASLVALCGTGVIICAAVDRVMRRIDELEERMDEHAANLAEQGQETAASVFVGAAASGRHLNAVPRG